MSFFPTPLKQPKQTKKIKIIEFLKIFIPFFLHILKKPYQAHKNDS